jgi:hypothetical protein
MKSLTIIIRQTEISKLFPEPLQLLLKDDASILDAIEAVDVEIKKKGLRFPVKNRRSLLQIVYHPNENRFYKQVAIQASSKSAKFLTIRENPKMPLPDETTVILVPEGGCTTDWEELVK